MGGSTKVEAETVNKAINSSITDAPLIYMHIAPIFIAGVCCREAYTEFSKQKGDGLTF